MPNPVPLHRTISRAMLPRSWLSTALDGLALLATFGLIVVLTLGAAALAA